MSSKSELKGAKSKVTPKLTLNNKVKNTSVKKTDNRPSNNDKIGKTLSKPVEVETRANLQQKVKFLEEELEKYDLERTRIVHELDRVCEERDNQIRELKTVLHEKQLEIDHQMNSIKNQRLAFEEEANKYQQTIDEYIQKFENREKELIGRNEILAAKLDDLNDYILNKEQTINKIRELEEIIKQERNFHKKIKNNLKTEIKDEKQRVEELVTTRVQEMATNLEASCMQKLSIDAKVALEKFVELSDNYEASETENRSLRQENKKLKLNSFNQRLRLEVAESLLTEMLKQLSRKFQRRRDAAVQCKVQSEPLGSAKSSKSSVSTLPALN